MFQVTTQRCCRFFLFSSLSPPSPDIVFFIFLYQRWIYRVDPKRVNEFGTSGEDHSVQGVTGDHNSPNPPISNGSAETTKTEVEKKND